MKRIERLVSQSATTPGTWTPTHYMSLKQARDANPGEYPSHFRLATGEPIRIIISDLPTIHKTRFKELGYWHMSGKGFNFWQCVALDGDRPAQVGTQYATKAELLANLEAYATEFGCDGAMPKSPVRPIDRAYDGQAHHMAKAANSLVTMLCNLDYSKFEIGDAVNLTRIIHRLINQIERAPVKEPECDCHPFVCGTNPYCAKHGLSAIAERKRGAGFKTLGVIDFDTKTITFPDRSRDDAGAADPRNDRED